MRYHWFSEVKLPARLELAGFDAAVSLASLHDADDGVQLKPRYLASDVLLGFLFGEHSAALVDGRLLGPQPDLSRVRTLNEVGQDSLVHYNRSLNNMKLEKLITSIFFALVVLDVLTPVQRAAEKKVEPPSPDPHIPRSKPATEGAQEGSEEPNRDKEDRVINDGFPVYIEIQYCNRTGLHSVYQEIEKKIYHNYHWADNIYVNPAPYPQPELNV